MGEHATVAEPGDGGDPVAFQGEHHQPVGARDRRPGVREVAAERRLPVCPRRHQPKAAFKASNRSKERTSCSILASAMG